MVQISSFGLFGGSIASTEQLLHSIGFTNYTELLAIGAGVTELVGGVIVALGLFRSCGCIRTVGSDGHGYAHPSHTRRHCVSLEPKGPYEIITLIAVMAATVILAGAGRWSVDGRWGWATRPKWGALVWLVVGIISAPVMWAVLNTQGFPF
ncbi:MAG: DoxX family protein [Lawsonella clevelandensis]